MSCQLVVAVLALVAGASASELHEPIVIDSEGHIASVMRRETPKAHLYRQDPTGVVAPTAASAATPGVTAPAGPAGAPTTANTIVAKPTGADSAATKTTNVEPVAPVISAPRSVKQALARSDLKYNFVEELDSSACNSHFEFKGELTNAQCAEHCYNTFGCTRFSAGGCSLGCRISVSGVNNPKKVEKPHDGQCPTSTASPASECVTYKLVFFNAQTTQGSCSAHFELIASAKNAAECAHACKNTPGCKKFSAEPNCMGGCRISKCGANAKASACPSDNQCAVTDDAKVMCTAYDLTTADATTQ